MSYRGTYEGNSLKHYRTKGSKNGYSKDPNYKPIGTPAQYELINNAHSATGRAGLLNNSYNHPSYQQAQAKAMQARNKAYGQAYGQMKVAGKNAALQKAKNVNSAKNVGATASHPTGQPNKGDYGKPDRQAQAEARRIAGGNAGSINAETKATMARIKGSAMVKTPQQRQAEAERRRIAGGNTGGWNLADMNRRAAEERRAGGFSKITDAAQSRKSNYQALVNRRAAEQRRTGVTSNQAAAEARRIAGSKLGSKYEDKGEGNFRRGASLAKQAFKEATHKRYYADYGRGHSSYDRAADHAKQAVKEFGSGVAKGTKSLVKNGKKKVKSLMKRFFG